MRILVSLMLTILLLSTAVLAEAERPLVLKAGTLTPRERLALPYYRIAVGPDRPHRVAGRTTPLTFAQSGESLLVDADAEPGCETVVEPGEAVRVALDEGELALVFLSGDPDAGEPAWSVVNLGCLAGAVGRTRVRFLDLDGDGLYLTPYTDYIIDRKGAVLHPVAPSLVLSRDVVRLRTDPERHEAWVTPDREFPDREIFPRFEGVVDGLHHLNGIRGRMNLPPVGLNREASRAVLLHIAYLERNGGNGHLERDDFPGYTREGAAAGLNAIGWMGGGSVSSAVTGHLSSLLHRMDLIDPRTTEVGIASRGERVWIHTECGSKRAWDGQGPQIFPGPGGAWSTGAYSGDNPDPRPDGYEGGCGLPVTCAWYGSEEILDVKAQLLVGGRPVRAFKNDAERRDLRMNHPAVRAVFLPRDTLKSGRLVLEWKQDGRPCRLTWNFRIG